MKASRVLAFTAAWLAAGALVTAQSRGQARTRDLRELQAELTNLDDELAALETDSPQSDRIRERAEEIREETIYLKVKMRKHQRAGETGTGVDSDEVEELRRSIRDLQREVSGGRRRGPREVRLPEGTEIVLRLEEALSSKTARFEDRFEATLAKPIRAQGVLAVPAGTCVRGIVQRVEPARRPSKSWRLELDFDALYVDKARVDLASRVVSVGEQEPERHSTETKAGAGAILGGTLGAILGGKEGAVVGVVLGGGGAVVATKGDDVDLPEGTLVTVRLDRPLTVPRAAHGRARETHDDDDWADGRMNRQR